MGEETNGTGTCVLCVDDRTGAVFREFVPRCYMSLFYRSQKSLALSPRFRSERLPGGKETCACSLEVAGIGTVNSPRGRKVEDAESAAYLIFIVAPQAYSTQLNST